MGKEYIITEFGDLCNKWCLYRCAGRDLERAKEILKECQMEKPGKEFHLETVEPEQAWWNDPSNF